MGSAWSHALKSKGSEGGAKAITKNSRLCVLTRFCGSVYLFNMLVNFSRRFRNFQIPNWVHVCLFVFVTVAPAPGGVPRATPRTAPHQTYSSRAEPKSLPNMNLFPLTTAEVSARLLNCSDPSYCQGEVT